MGRMSRFAVLPILAWSLPPTLRAADVPDNWVEAGFFFDWTTAGTPVPVVEQCDSLPISWSRGASVVGPNPTAPYVLQIYTSTFITPLIVDAGSDQKFNWTVPFVPDTQFQICMFDKEGVPGGCQRIMTVIPNSADPNPTCRNLTYPTPEQGLQVTALDATGPMSQYGWPAQCTDLSITPINGTPPYTLTVAPTLHPPYNITSNTTGVPINWTISLSWASPFFISLVDSAGNAWANGPLHSGRGPSNRCLSSKEKSDDGNTVSVAVVAGSSAAAAVGGLLLGLLGAFLLYRRQHGENPRVTRRPSHDVLLAHDTMSSARTSLNMGGNSLGATAGRYRVEPWVPPPISSAASTVPQSSDTDAALSPPNTAATTDGRPGGSRAGGSHVYVVHHDGGRAPVTVYTEDGMEVVELPPRYTGGSTGQAPEGARGVGTASEPRRRLHVHEQRQPNAPRKTVEVRLDPPPGSPSVDVSTPRRATHSDTPGTMSIT